VNVTEEITRLRKIKEQRPISWNLTSIAGFAEDILLIRKQRNNKFINK
jgi:hypothetical protein